jgi:hypothetical protein
MMEPKHGRAAMSDSAVSTKARGSLATGSLVRGRLMRWKDDRHKPRPRRQLRLIADC